MKSIALIASLLIKVLLADDSNPTGCIQGFDANKDYFPNKIHVDTATLFSVEYKNYYKVLTNKAVNETYVLYQCGADKPKVDNVKQFFEIPVKNVAAMDTSSVFFLQMLGVFDKIKKVGTIDYISSPCVNKGVNDKSIATVDSNGTLQTGENQDKFSDIDVIFSSSSSKNDPKTVVVSAVSDPGALERTEWVEFFSTFFNLEKVGNAASAAINDNFNCIKKNTKAPGNGVTVAWASYLAAYDSSPESWIISNAAYKKQLTEYASAKLLATSSATFSDPKEFIKQLQSANYIIDETYGVFNLSSVAKAYTLSSEDDLPAFKNKKIYRIDGLGNAGQGYDWYESAVPFEDAVLQDLVRILGTNTTALASDNRLWFRNVATEDKQVLQVGDCRYDGKPTGSRAGQCKGASGSSGSSDKGNSNASTHIASWTLGLVSLIATMMI